MVFLLFLACVSGAVAAEPLAEGGVAITYRLPKACQVTLNITRRDGWIVRELVVDQSRSAGPQREIWDGRDGHGRHCPPGEYQARVLTHEPLGYEYVTSIGNSGTPAWQTYDRTGGWGGNHGNPVAVAADASGVYLGWNSTEGPYALLKRSPDGSRGIWGNNLGGFHGVAALAADGEYVYVAGSKSLVALDAEGGKTLAKIELDGALARNAPPLADDPQSLSGVFRSLGVWGLAARQRRVYVSNAKRNAIEVFELVAGDPGARYTMEFRSLPDQNLPLPRPRGLAFTPDGRLLAVSEGKVYSIDLATKQPAPLIQDHLVAPFAITCDGAEAIYVSDLGASQQIKKFTPQGKFLAAWGREGGAVDLRSGGAFKEQDFRWPVALAVGADHSVWLAEDMIPKRVARLSPDGKVLYQGFGSVNHAAQTAANPNNPSEVFSTMWGLFSAYVDYDKKTWRIGRIIRPNWKGENYGFKTGDAPDQMLARDGRTYLWSGPFPSKPGIGLNIVEENLLRPVVYFAAGATKSPEIQALAKSRGAEKLNTFWCDRNSDRAVQLEEVQFIAPMIRGIAPDFTLLGKGMTWKPRLFNAEGVPYYDPADLKETPEATEFRGTNGAFYQIFHSDSRSFPHGNGFWSARSSLNALVCHGPGEKWSVGRKAATAARPGEVYYLWRILGEMGDCIFVSDVEGLVHVFHRNGFYVQSLLQDNRLNNKPGPGRLSVENFSGTISEDPAANKKRLHISSSEASHIFDITGLDTIKVHPPHRFMLVKSQVNWATNTAQQPYTIPHVPVIARRARIHGSHGLLPVVHFDWRREVPALPLFDQGKLLAELRLAYAGKMLYALVDVYGREPEPGRVNDRDPKNLFKSGHGFELLLGLNPNASFQRTQPEPGDVSFVAIADGAGLVAPLSDAHPPMTSRKLMEALGGTLNVAQKTWIQRASHIEPCPNGTGYQIELAIQLRDTDFRSLWRLPKASPADSADELLDDIDLAEEKKSKPSKRPPDHLRRTLGGQPIRFDAALRYGPLNELATTKMYWHAGGPNSTVQSPLTDALLPATWGYAVFAGSPDSATDLAKASQTAQPKKIDGDPADWAGVAALAIDGDNGPIGHFKTAYDPRAFYALVHVKDATPLVNGAPEEALLIKGGDALGFCFGGKKNVPLQKIVAARRSADRTDLLISYLPRSKVKQPYRFRSPVSSVELAYVGPPLPSEAQAKVAFRPAAGGYFAEIEIPWEVIGVAPTPGMTLPFDLQLMFSDAAGSSNAQNAWWCSRGAESACTFDLPTEAKLHPDFWGTLELQAP